MNEQLKNSLDLMERIDEISPNKKRQIKNNALNILTGKEDNIKTFLIITAENPMGEKSTNNINRVSNDNIVKYLKAGNYAWQRKNTKR